MVLLDFCFVGREGMFWWYSNRIVHPVPTMFQS